MKKIISIVAGLTLLTLFALPVLAKGPSAPAGNSNKGQLYLYEKNPSDWTIVENGAWGKMTYDLSGPEFSYVFNGHALISGTDYTLIYYPDPWPGTGLKCLGAGTVVDGNIHIQNSLVTGTLPIEDDGNTTGAKIWLVKSADVKCDAITEYNVVGTWKWLVLGTYEHDLVITSQDSSGAITGTGGYPAGTSPYLTGTTETITGTVTGNQITFTTTYAGPYNPGYSVTVSGTIAPDGTISGTTPWEWHTTSGNAIVPSGSMMTGWNPTEYLFEDALINFTETP